MAEFELSGILRRIRRTADVSQRELAERSGLSKTAIATAEAGTRGLDARDLARAATVAGLRLTLLDGDGAEVVPMDGDAVRDEGGRRFPAHLDTRHGDDGWWHGPHRYDRPPVTYTFTRDRDTRDRLRRARGGTPTDHQQPRPGDTPAERAAARRAAARRARAEELERRRAAGRWPVEDLRCTCPPACDEFLLGEEPPRPGERPRHAADCPCGCDVG